MTSTNPKKRVRSVKLVPLQAADKEQFIRDNQAASSTAQPRSSACGMPTTKKTAKSFPAGPSSAPSAPAAPKPTASSRAPEDVEAVVRLYLGGASREALDPRLDACAAHYKESLDTAEQIQFKSAAKEFLRTYNFLSSILPYGNAEWERLSLFLNLLVPKLPSPDEEDLSVGILEAVDLESYRNEVGTAMKIVLDDKDGELKPVPTGIAAGPREVELNPVSVIISDFNDRFGNIDWKDKDNVLRQIREMPGMVSKDERYQNAIRNSSRDNARLESDRALMETILTIMNDNMELFKQFQGNPEFKQWLSDFVFNATYRPEQ